VLNPRLDRNVVNVWTFLSYLRYLSVFWFDMAELFMPAELAEPFCPALLPDEFEVTATRVSFRSIQRVAFDFVGMQSTCECSWS
jgi:hypothetical protein